MPLEAGRDLYDTRIRIGTCVVGLSFETYARVDRIRDSVERCVEIISEAVRQATSYLSDLVALFPDAHAIIGMRNIVSHAYGEVNDAIVWPAGGGSHS